MDDYNLTINPKTTRAPAYLNGLSERRALFSVYTTKNEWRVSPCIEEDRRIVLESVVGQYKNHHLTADESRLLYQTLPLDLPSVRKDLLICLAAHDGNIDRYVHLYLPTIPYSGMAPQADDIEQYVRASPAFLEELAMCEDEKSRE